VEDIGEIPSRAVQEFRAQLDDPPRELRVGNSICLKFHRSGREYDTLLVLGGSSDHDSGGFVIAELLENLEICIAEKTRKIAAFREKYDEWWLALEDRIAYGALDSDDLRQLRAAIGPVPGFARILLVNPLEPAHAVDVLVR
jgi:hypothetical protein